MKVKLVSMSGEAFEVEAKVAAVSRLVHTIVAAEVLEIPLPNVKASVLAKVVEFCQHCKDEPMGEIQKPLRSNVLSDSVDEWYAQFVEETDQELLFELILAANFMNIKALLDLCCAKMLCMVKGKTPEEICATFNMAEEFTEEEKQQIFEEENKRCEDVYDNHGQSRLFVLCAAAMTLEEAECYSNQIVYFERLI